MGANQAGEGDSKGFNPRKGLCGDVNPGQNESLNWQNTLLMAASQLTELATDSIRFIRSS